MADVPTPTTPPIADAAGNAVQELDATLRLLVTKLLGERGADGAKKLLSSMVGGLKDGVGALKSSIDMSGILDLDQKQVQSKFMDAMEKGTKELSKLSAKVGVELDTKKVNDSLTSVATGLANFETLASFGFYKAATSMAKAFEKNPISEFLLAVERDATRIDKLGLENFGNRLNPANINEAAGGLANLNAAYRGQLADLVAMGISLDRAENALNELGNSSKLSLDQIQNLGAGAADLGNHLDGVAGFQRILAATGISAGTASKVLELQMRSLGVQAGDSLAIFDTFNKVQMGTKLTSTEVAQNITSAGEKFKFFGNNLTGVSAIYKELLSGLGEGSEDIAKSLNENIAAGLSNMSMEMKAFIGMTSQLGGGGGALESSLKIEEAMASGEGLKEVFDSIYDTIEERSGAKILTRKEAMETGQEQQFVVQRELLKQATGVNNGMELNKLMEARAAGKGVTPDQLRTGQDFGKMTSGAADMAMNQQIGGMQRTANQVSGTAELEGTRELSKRMLSIGQGLTPAGDELVKALNGISAKVHDFSKQGFSYKEITSGKAAKSAVETMGESAAARKTDKDLIEAGKSGKGLSENEELLGNIGQAQLRDKKMEQLKEQVAIPTVVQKTQAELKEQAAPSAVMQKTQPELKANMNERDITRATGLKPLESNEVKPEMPGKAGTADLSYYTNMMTLQDKGNAYLNEIKANTSKAMATTSDSNARVLNTKPVLDAAPPLRTNTLQVNKPTPEDAKKATGGKSFTRPAGTEIPISFVVTMVGDTVKINPASDRIQASVPQSEYE